MSYAVSMPCYFFTFHAYGTWLPDRKRGFIRHDGEGVHKQDIALGQTYKQQMKQDIVYFDHKAQQCMIQALLDAADIIDIRLHGIGTDTTHLHILTSWYGQRTWEQLRYKLKRVLTYRLAELHQQQWFVRAGSRKRVKDHEHFNYLMHEYIPKHQGHKWFETCAYKTNKTSATRSVAAISKTIYK